jgi:hypothetical protein
VWRDLEKGGDSEIVEEAGDSPKGEGKWDCVKGRQ